MSAIKVTDDTFQEQVLEAKGAVLVDLWAPWCGPCKQVAPVLEDIATEMGERLVLAKLDVDENPHTATRYGVSSIPTLMLFRDGELLDSRVGASSRTRLVEWIEELL